jgi:predicted GNAT family acetyltransferase
MAVQTVPVKVEHEAARRRFVAHFPEGDGKLIYKTIAPHTLDLAHTVVDPALRGRGIAKALAREAFAYARRENLKVVPTCPFIQRWLEQHPEERDLVTTRADAT